MKQTLYRAVSPFLERRLNRNPGTIGLCYHRFTPPDGRDPVPGMGIPPDQFRMHLDALGALGEFIAIDNAIADTTSQGVRFFLTFDDGYRDNLTVLLPILEEYRCPVCIYVVGGIANESLHQLEHDRLEGYQPDLLSPEDIQSLAGHPLVTLGSHTLSHSRLSGLSDESLKQEIQDGNKALIEITGNPVHHFAAPYGGRRDARWRELRRTAGDLGLKTVSSNFGGINRNLNPEKPSAVHLKRVSMGPIAEPWNVSGWVLRKSVGV